MKNAPKPVEIATAEEITVLLTEIYPRIAKDILENKKNDTAVKELAVVDLIRGQEARLYFESRLLKTVKYGDKEMAAEIVKIWMGENVASIR